MASKFIIVKCKCGNEQNIFSHSSRPIDCKVCGNRLASPSGGKAIITNGKIVKELE
ncbi:MAG: 30S ribosomal protein S27e [Candidatus Micrarchaeia archaeon]